MEGLGEWASAIASMLSWVGSLVMFFEHIKDRSLLHAVLNDSKPWMILFLVLSFFPTIGQDCHLARNMALRVAYTVGRGTEKALADIFERAMLKLSTHYSVLVELHASARIYHADFPLLEDYSNPKDVETVNRQDALYYEDFCREQVAQGTRVTLTPAINVQSLYLARQHLQAVYVECFEQGSKSLLLVGDQSQGLYAGKWKRNKRAERFHG